MNILEKYTIIIVEVKELENKLYSKVFNWLFVGLLVTFGSGFLLSLYPNAVMNILGGTGYLVAIVVEVAIALFFGFRVRKMSEATAKFCYLLYSIVTGVTFSIIFLTYELTSLMMVFAITAIIFGIFAFFGKVTNLPLNKMGTFLFMGLLAVIIAGIVNIFIGSSQFSFILCIVSIILFIGYIAYDTKKLPAIFDLLGEDKGAIYGAFELYLDFINLFLRLLELFGKSKDD